MKPITHAYTATTKPCGSRYRLTVYVDGRPIDKYVTVRPVVYALICSRPQAEGIAQLTRWVRFLRHTAIRFEQAQTSDTAKLVRLFHFYSPFMVGLAADGWYEAVARGLRERLKQDCATLRRLRSGREEYFEPYVRSYHRRRDLAIRARPRGARVLEILEVRAPALRNSAG